MFEKFGEFDSVEELNRAADAQLKDGDMEAVIAIALENGIDKEDAEEFIEGYAPELATPLMAAVGKLNIEAKELELVGVLEDWKESIVQICTEDEEFSKAVRKTGKKLANCMGELLKYSFNSKKQVSEIICKAAGLRNGNRKDPVYMGIPSKAEAKKIIRNYYVG